MIRHACAPHTRHQDLAKRRADDAKRREGDVKKTLMVAVLLATALFRTGNAAAAEMTGYVSDHSCASGRVSEKRAMDWIKPDLFEACVKKCVKEGSEMVFVTEDNRILTFDAASTKKVRSLMGHRVKLTGTSNNGVLKVDSVAAIAFDK